MTQLDLVKLVVRALGDEMPIALETGQATIAGDAEFILDEKRTSIFADRDWSILQATEYILISAGNGLNFCYGETVTESTSGATGRLIGYDNGTAWIQKTTSSVAFTGAGTTLTGAISAATRVTGTRTAFPRDTTPAVAAITHKMAMYIGRAAAVEFQTWKKRGQVDNSYLMQMLTAARAQALHEDSDFRSFNYLQTRDLREAKGEISAQILNPYDGYQSDEN